MYIKPTEKQVLVLTIVYSNDYIIYINLAQLLTKNISQFMPPPPRLFPYKNISRFMPPPPGYSHAACCNMPLFALARLLSDIDLYIVEKMVVCLRNNVIHWQWHLIVISVMEEFPVILRPCPYLPSARWPNNLVNMHWLGCTRDGILAQLTIAGVTSQLSWRENIGSLLTYAYWSGMGCSYSV